MAHTKKHKKVKRTKPRLKRLPKGPNGGVELLLIQSVEQLGKQGEIVEVRPGYANNYLIPQGFATFATEHLKRMVEKHNARVQAIERARLSDLQGLANRIGKQSVTIEANAKEEGHLYGSVGAAEIVDALKQVDLTIASEHVRLEGPLRELGLYSVKIQLHQDVNSELKVWVVPTAAEE